MVKGGRGRGKGVGGTPSAPTKRPRTPSDEIESEEIEIDPDLIMDTLLACLNKTPTLLDKFLNHLLEAPAIQAKITEKVLGVFEPNIPSSDDLASDPDSLSKSENAVETSTLITCLKELTNAVKELKSELKSSKQRCDELEQYSRRNNIIISGIPESDTHTAEDQAINMLNSYVTEPIQYGEIDRCHRLYRAKSKSPADKRPADIIIKFVSRKSKARILTKDPMEKLRADNDSRSEKSRIYVREDLTKKRGDILYKARQLKKAGLVKDAFTRDGIIIIRMRPNKPFQKDINIRISNEDELKSFCQKFKLPVNDECTPLSKPDLKKTAQSPAIASTSKEGADLMDIQDSMPLSCLAASALNKTLNADAVTFSPVHTNSTGSMDNPNSGEDSG